MSTPRVFLVKVAKYEEMTVTSVGYDHDDAMASAERKFTGWTAVEATEDERWTIEEELVQRDAIPPTPDEVLKRLDWTDEP